MVFAFASAIAGDHNKKRRRTAKMERNLLSSATAAMDGEEWRKATDAAAEAVEIGKAKPRRGDEMRVRPVYTWRVANNRCLQGTVDDMRCVLLPSAAHVSPSTNNKWTNSGDAATAAGGGAPRVFRSDENPATEIHTRSSPLAVSQLQLFGMRTTLSKQSPAYAGLPWDLQDKRETSRHRARTARGGNAQRRRSQVKMQPWE